ncbi:MAG: glycosyltransferase family 4 protein [Idiomarina sp.]|nr:glycosyltransferase family 4 protein [Idiomarina sp.]
MKLVYISSSNIPSRAANSIHVMKMSSAFADSKCDVTLIGVKGKVDPDISGVDFYNFYGVRSNFKIDLIDVFEGRGRSVFYGLYSAIKAFIAKPDIVYSRHIVGAYFSSLLGLKVVFESHTPIANSGKMSLMFFKSLISRKNFTGLTVITEALRQHYLDNYSIAASKIRVFPDGADEVVNRNEIQLTTDPERLQIGYTGHLFDGRGIDLIIDIAKHCDWADFHFVGGMAQDIARWKEESKSQTNVVFHGFVAPGMVPDYRASMDVLLAPYQEGVKTYGGGDTTAWMSPLKVFEYMASGKAIVASSLPVLNEVLQDGDNALLAAPSCLESWCLAIRKLRDEPDLRARLGTKAHEDFTSKYSWHMRAKNILREYGGS